MAKTLNVIFDTKTHPVNHECVQYYAMAAAHKEKHGYDRMDLWIQPPISEINPSKSMWTKEEKERRLENIVIPCANLYPFHTIHRPKERVPVDNPFPVGWELRTGQPIKPYRWQYFWDLIEREGTYPSVKPDRPWVRDWVRSHGLEKFVVFVLRGDKNHPERNANIKAWISVAEWINLPWVACVDGDADFPGLVFPSMRPDDRAQLFEKSSLVAGVGGGAVAAALLHHDVPTVVFKVSVEGTDTAERCLKKNGFKGGQTPPFVGRKKLCWVDDTFENIQSELKNWI